MINVTDFIYTPKPVSACEYDRDIIMGACCASVYCNPNTGTKFKLSTGVNLVTWDLDGNGHSIHDGDLVLRPNFRKKLGYNRRITQSVLDISDINVLTHEDNMELFDSLVLFLEEGASKCKERRGYGSHIYGYYMYNTAGVLDAPESDYSNEWGYSVDTYNGARYFKVMVKGKVLNLFYVEGKALFFKDNVVQELLDIFFKPVPTKTLEAALDNQYFTACSHSFGLSMQTIREFTNMIVQSVKAEIKVTDYAELCTYTVKVDIEGKLYLQMGSILCTLPSKGTYSNQEIMIFNKAMQLAYELSQAPKDKSFNYSPYLTAVELLRSKGTKVNARAKMYTLDEEIFELHLYKSFKVVVCIHKNIEGEIVEVASLASQQNAEFTQPSNQMIYALSKLKTAVAAEEGSSVELEKGIFAESCYNAVAQFAGSTSGKSITLSDAAVKGIVNSIVTDSKVKQCVANSAPVQDSAPTTSKNNRYEAPLEEPLCDDETEGLYKNLLPWLSKYTSEDIAKQITGDFIDVLLDYKCSAYSASEVIRCLENKKK